jgi:N-acetylneuraminic acid mutarotase
MCAFVLNGKAYVGTGTDEDILRQDFYMYDPVLNVWTARASLPGSGRFGCTGFAIGQKGYVALGIDGGYKDEVWEYDPINNSWMIKSPYDGGARRSAAGFVVNGSAYIGTGKGASGSRRDFWQYQQYIIGLDEQAAIGNFSVFPNPCADLLTIAIPENLQADHTQLIIYSMDGRELLREVVTAKTLVRIDTHTFASGIYCCVLQNDHAILNQTQFIVR